MHQYEYIKVPASALMIENSISEELLNVWGNDGWELVTITNWNGKAAFFYFKREKF